MKFHKIAFALPLTMIASAMILPHSASASTVRCFGLEGERTTISKTVELKAREIPGTKAQEFVGQGDSYSFRATVLEDNSVVLGIWANVDPVGLGATSPAFKLEPLLETPSVIGLLRPTSTLMINNPGDKNPNGFVGCGLQ